MFFVSVICAMKHSRYYDTLKKLRNHDEDLINRIFVEKTKRCVMKKIYFFMTPSAPVTIILCLLTFLYANSSWLFF